MCVRFTVRDGEHIAPSVHQCSLLYKKYLQVWAYVYNGSAVLLLQQQYSSSLRMGV